MSDVAIDIIWRPQVGPSPHSDISYKTLATGANTLACKYL